MKTCEKWLNETEVALAADVFTEHSLYQGWYNWRRSGDVAPNFMTVKGGLDRLDRSGLSAGGPSLLARPNYVDIPAAKYGLHRI